MNQNNKQYHYQMPPQPPQAPPMPPRQSQPYPIPRRTKNKFLTFCCALVPGAGQMYHGLLKKGLSVMILFFGVIALSAIVYMPILCISLPVIWFYSFFDTVNRMNMPLEELSMLNDNWLFYDADLGKVSKNKAVAGIIKERHLIFGWALILLALWILLNMFVNTSMFYYFCKNFMNQQLYYVLQDSVSRIPSLIIPLFCVILGFKLIKREDHIKKGYEEYQLPHGEN